jgi:hypothetical protein
MGQMILFFTLSHVRASARGDLLQPQNIAVKHRPWFTSGYCVEEWLPQMITLHTFVICWCGSEVNNITGT